MHSKNFKNNNITINKEYIPLGTNKLLKIPVDRLPTGTNIEIPVYIFNGEELGPTVLLQGGLHGNEVNGIEIVRRMLIDKDYTVKKGCVIIIPLLNVFGFLNLSRNMHGKDVNRSFPGSKNGSLASRMARFLSKEIIPKINFAIDFHTGGEQRSNYPQIRYTPESVLGYKLAQVFNAPLMFGSKTIPKSFRNECHKNNIPTIVYEGGESLRLDENAIQEGINGTLRVLQHFNMLQNSVELLKDSESVELDQRKWIRATKAGLFKSTIANGSKVIKNEVLGSITDTYGATKTILKAPYEGYIIAVNNFPVINRGDALFHIGVKK